jgi:hypothetical protein
MSLRDERTPLTRSALRHAKITAIALVIGAAILMGASTCRPTAKVGGGCTALRDCCDEVDRALPADPNRTEECASWTRTSPNALYSGECGYGTDCWCDRMLEVFRTKYAMCR